jgi:thymidine kinase
VHVVSHNGDRERCVSVASLRDVLDSSEYSDAEVVFVEEGQFFSDLRDTVVEMVEAHHKIVYVSGLSGDSNRHKFGEILDLVPFADSVEHCRAFCKLCGNGNEAPFSKRRSSADDELCADGTHSSRAVARDKGQVLVGGAERYEATCRLHYHV